MTDSRDKNGSRERNIPKSPAVDQVRVSLKKNFKGVSPKRLNQGCQDRNLRGEVNGLEILTGTSYKSGDSGVSNFS